ncbi:hypothetical protein V1522DRAFT_391084 [Lipomyces starkeyi]
MDGIDPLESYDGMMHDDHEEFYPEGAHPGIPGLWRNPYFKKSSAEDTSSADSAAAAEFDENVHEKVHKHFSDYVAQVDERERHHGRRLSSSASSSAEVPHGSDKQEQHAEH